MPSSNPTALSHYGAIYDGALLSLPAAQLSQPDLHRSGGRSLVIAADGEANLCIFQGWPVDAVVGDADSVDPHDLRGRAAGVPFHRYPVEKDETDLEIALHLALDLGANEILIAGALGARIDHTLGNLALLALPHARRGVPPS